MVIARLLAVGLLSATLSVSCGQTGGVPTNKVVVQAMHLKWPDGSWVESGGLHYPTDIYVVDANGKHIRNLTHDNPTNYLIDRLPDSQRILYESVPSDRMRAGLSRIFSISEDGGGRRQLASGKGELLPKLSPDGHRILFARGRWLYVMRSDGTDKTPLVQANFGYYVPYAGPNDASWSPDGGRVAFVRGFAKQKAYSSHSALYVINADGTGLRRLTKRRPKVETMDPVWAPDGRKIGFDEYRYPMEVSNRTYVMRADGSHVKRLKPLDGFGATAWFWLSNNRIAYQVETGRLRSIDADGTGKPQALPHRVRVGGKLWISGPAAEFWPVSPDGKWIAFATGPRSVWIAHLDGTHRRLVTRKICCVVWSFAIDWAGK
jgi:dipeptidyl aminopeptidase/acylaminoacyl peptidase